MTTMLS